MGGGGEKRSRGRKCSCTRRRTAGPNVAGWPQAEHLEALGFQRCSKCSRALLRADPHATFFSNNNSLLLSSLNILPRPPLPSAPGRSSLVGPGQRRCSIRASPDVLQGRPTRLPHPARCPGVSDVANYCCVIGDSRAKQCMCDARIKCE